MSLWEKHKAKIYHYGHIYATLYGLMVINYIPARPTNTLTHRLTVLYSHVVGALLIVVCPVYFISHYDALVESKDRRGQLQLVVNFVNTLIKYVTVVMTYGANLAQYTAMREITKTRQQLEDALEALARAHVQSQIDSDAYKVAGKQAEGTKAGNKVKTKAKTKVVSGNIAWTKDWITAGTKAVDIIEAETKACTRADTGATVETKPWTRANAGTGIGTRYLTAAANISKPGIGTKARTRAWTVIEIGAETRTGTSTVGKNGTVAKAKTRTWTETVSVANTRARRKVRTGVGSLVKSWFKERVKAYTKSRSQTRAVAGTHDRFETGTTASSQSGIAASNASCAAAKAIESQFQSHSQSQWPRHQFERMLLFKFGLINTMMLLQVASMLYQHFGVGVQPVRLQYAIYTFILWNYTENMADYFYFINCSTLRFYRQLQQQLQQLVLQAQLLKYRGSQRGYAMELCNQLCDRLDDLAMHCQQIHQLYSNGVRMQQFQILGLIFTTLISNLTNFFTLFNLFSKQELDQASPEIALSVFHALVFYVDTYIVALISDQISGEKATIGDTMQGFNGIAALDVRLEQTIERFTLQLIQSKAEVRICGFFPLNRHLTYATAAAGFSYFITLVQFDMSL